ncbi:junctional associated with coronary artery disease isoform X1 [Pelobates cultripes]|uniref:Junctional associated with coronary artery disease isoform X1 n=1 Tax=Pelobates cultripes TaxID=61616 RepID=A0AAD1W3P4_PELCU|nr:junctional associated with coronary artery disease isoform X1 [Pelobates cultripes]
MFSVEDLLVSHGYRVSKNSLSTYQTRSDGCQVEATENRSGNNVTLNGYQTDREVFDANPNPLAKSNLESDYEKGCMNKRRQIHSVGYPKGQQCFEPCHNSETGFPDRPQPERSCWTKTSKDVQYWRRRAQDFSVLLGQGEDGGAVDKIITSDIGGKRECSIVERNVTDGSNVVNMENGRNNMIFKHWKQPLEDRQEHANKNITKDFKASGREGSDATSEKSPQEFISATHGDKALVCHNMLKPQLLPKVISPEIVRPANIPSVTGDNSPLKHEITQLQDKYVASNDCRRNSFSKPKYSRPSKPPSYELHQQTWGAVESSESPDSQKDEQLLFSGKVESSLEPCFQETCLEPPIYIPPPSYKSPPLQNATNQSFIKVPKVGDCCHQIYPVEKTSTSNKALTSFPGNNVPYDKQVNHGHGDNCKECIQYISFDDPCIKHIAVPRDKEKQDHSKKRIEMKESKNQESNVQKRERVSAFTKSKNGGNNYVKREGIKHKQWLHVSIPDQMRYPLPEYRDGSTACSLPDDHEPTHKLSLKKTHSDSACETVTKVKKFGPDTYLRSKRNSKRRLNETIFCLVSIPVKSDSASSEISKNNKGLADATDRMNMLKHSSGGLPEQMLLSTSSSDLELQTLTGSMNNNSELLKQAQSKTEENKQANDLTSVEQRKHRELAYSGSWPGDQYKDQQTQTVFTDIQNSTFCDGSKSNEQHTKCSASNCGPAELILAPENVRHNMYSMKGQMSLSPSSNSAFSRTSSLMTHLTKAEPCQRLELSNENANGKEKLAVGKCEKNEIEEGHFCNKKEVFGQFLLKPVNRRPWDAISELESLNKEFQEQERANEGEKNVAKDETKEVPMEICTTKNATENEMASSHQHVLKIQEIPAFEQLQEKRKSESWCTEKLIHDNKDGDKLQKCAKIKNIKSKSGKLLDECVTKEVQVQSKRTENATGISHSVTPNVHHIKLKIHTHSSQVHNDKSQCAPVVNSYYFREDKKYFERPAVDVIKMTSTKFGEVSDTMKKLSQEDRNHGQSVPDLTKQADDANHNEELYEVNNDSDIPENESLYERAARILGIDVAGDTLVSPGCSEAQSPENLTSNGRGQLEEKTKDKFCEVSFSMKETSGVFSNFHHSPTDTERPGQKLMNFEQGQVSPLSNSLHGELNVSRNAEKRVRNTSKMIETLQGKLASTPVRTAVDRLARMKEVDSVSRMRRLSIKSTDSGDEVDDEKQLYRVQETGARKFSAGAIYKRVISLDESLLITKSRDTLDLSFADAYDPARVERV